MKTLLKTLLKEIIKKYLPLIVNAVCASICVTSAGCTVINHADNVETTPLKMEIAE